MEAPRKASLGRILITPLIVLVAAFLVLGMPGLVIGALVGIVYVVWASNR